MKFALIATLLLVLLPAAAWADIDVEPAPWSPKVSIKAKDSRPPAAARARRTKSDVIQDLPYQCFFDASEPDFRCALQDFPERAPTDGADLSPGDILTAAREVGMPPLKVQIQPGGRTLVNVDTIFYTDPTHLRRTVTLLGHSVRLDAAPVRYTWVHGDGTRASTSTPGRPYPAKDVTHQYRRPDDNLRARVDTTYRVRYSVDGGGWADLAETLTAPGPTTTLDVDEAAPVLTH